MQVPPMKMQLYLFLILYIWVYMQVPPMKMQLYLFLILYIWVYMQVPPMKLQLYLFLILYIWVYMQADGKRTLARLCVYGSSLCEDAFSPQMTCHGSYSSAVSERKEFSEHIFEPISPFYL